MIFESLSERLQETFKKLRGHGKLTEDDVNEAMREVRMALLEADVNFKVVKDFIKTVKERAVGQEILETLTPASHAPLANAALPSIIFFSLISGFLFVFESISFYFSALPCSWSTAFFTSSWWVLSHSSAGMSGSKISPP